MHLLRGKYLIVAAELTALIALQAVYLIRRRRRKPLGAAVHSVNGHPVVSSRSLNSQGILQSNQGGEFRYTPPAAAPPLSE